MQCHGTEGRAGGGLEIYPSDSIYDFVVFNSADIKDLHVHERPVGGGGGTSLLGVFIDIYHIYIEQNEEPEHEFPLLV